MNDVIITIIGLVIAGGALLALQHWLANANRYREEMTDEEYEESLERDPGFIGAGMMALDQNIFRRSAERAIEYRIDAEQGQLPGGGGQGESWLPDSDADDASSQSCESDASSSTDCESDSSSSSSSDQ